MSSANLATVYYTAGTHVTGGRVGAGNSSDRALDVQLSTPGSGRPGIIPSSSSASATRPASSAR